MLDYTSLFAITTLGFSGLYFGSAWLCIWLMARSKGERIDARVVQPAQVRMEIVHSLISIAMFGLLTVFTLWLVNRGWLHVSWTMSLSKLPVEILALFLWNEIHFYSCHRLLHTKWLYRHVHYKHHQSKTPTPYSTFSFHYIEALLLGSVMTTALIFYSFSVISLLTLPLMSIVLNTLGHCNFNFFPGRPADSLLSFTVRHSDHHERNTGNYGFFLPYFDQLFKTSSKERRWRSS
ncbi:sterol desaturase family protein [Paenibacillus sp. HJGM_3]|uniref:sterol desaturase family protein n=1 Tax=Paenibacillus sp. HJGM_3 TaxID=3379816 RepID=UPI003866574D